MKRLTKWISELVCQLSGFSNDDSRLLPFSVRTHVAKELSLKVS